MSRSPASEIRRFQGKDCGVDVAGIIESGQSSAWLYLPVAVLLGALHGLEPGHSKTMMAAFIVAIRGTVLQAVLLGLSAAVSHSALIAVLAIGALRFGTGWTAEKVAPYLEAVSGACIGLLSLWVLARARRELHPPDHGHHHHGHHHHGHHHHGHHHHGHHHHGDYHGHGHHHGDGEEDREFQDAHEREHAAEIAARFAGRTVTTPQIILFGLTGGLMPCPAAFSVFLICLQLKRVTLGVAMVAAFSVGLALTMVAAGVAAAWGIRHAGSRFAGFGTWARRAPQVSAGLMLCAGLAMLVHGLQALGRL
jgi:nickel/cobalt exporter